jgi:hypothetical protein
MESTIQNTDWSALRQHLPLFALLLFSLPPVSFVLIKVVLAANSAAKQKVTKQWYISREEEQAAKSYYFDPDAEHHDSIFDARPRMAAQPFKGHAVKSAGRK